MFANTSVLRRILAVSASGALVGSVLGGGVAAADELSVPVYAVVQEGLTAEEGAQLAEAFGTENALQANGLFSFADAARFGQVPLTKALRAERDESGRRVQPQAIDFAALERLKPVPDEEALEYGYKLLDVAALSPGLTAKPTVSHTELTITDEHNRAPEVHPLDTVVNFGLELGGLPVTGQGAKLRLTVGPDGGVTQLSHALRRVERSGDVTIIGPERAAETCAALYGPDVRQDAPTLGYQFPALTAVDASGKGSVGTIFPQYTCNPLGGEGAQAHRLVPAVEDSAPSGKLAAARKGATIDASVSVSGGTAPYTYVWSSSTTALPTEGRNGDRITYQRTSRDRADDGSEHVTVEVTDANGLTATAGVDLNSDG